MPNTQKIVLSNNAVIGVEVLDSKVESDVANRQGGGVSFASVVPSIVGICKELDSAVGAISPKRATVEFGLRLSMETSGLVAILTKGSVEANLKVSLEWESKPEKK